MILTLREQAVIKEWNKKGIGGLRVSSLALLENIGGRDGFDDSRGVAEVLIRHTLRMMPQGLWFESKGYCEEICFLAGVDFDEATFFAVKIEEENERVDEEFED